MPENYFYVTTPIYYVNDVPHIGHAYTSVAADILARFMRLDGRKVMFLTGTDEHGKKVERAAAEAGVDPKVFVDQVSQRFRDLSKTLKLTNDDFIRTTETRHAKAAQAFWGELLKRDQIYESTYSGWYSVRDETYYAESELIEGKAPTGAEVEWVEEPSYFFRLSKWQQPLLEFYENNPYFIGPETRRNEVISFVKVGIRDISISRSTFSWGVPVPGDKKHIMYVWVEALINYLTAIGYPDTSAKEYKVFWPESLHIIGKDIPRFHAVYWPALLLAAGLLPPKRVFAHGWWTNDGEKISKSLGNVIDPFEIIANYGLDQVRYFLVREIPFGNDGNFSQTAMVKRINSDLANDFGNLVQRVLSFVQKYARGVIPTPGEMSENDQKILKAAQDLPDQIRMDADKQALNKMCESLWAVVAQANRYIDQEEPWVLRKTDTDHMNTVLYVLIETIRYLGILSSPIVPNAANRILDQLNIPEDERNIAALQAGMIQPGIELPKPEGVFPRIAV